MIIIACLCVKIKKLETGKSLSQLTNYEDWAVSGIKEHRRKKKQYGRMVMGRYLVIH